MKLLFFIPSFNDQLGLSELIKSIFNVYPLCSVLVIDDGSEPPLILNIENILPLSNFFLHRIAFNVGLGLVTSVAIDYFLNGDFDILIRMDADGQHPLSEIEGLILPFKSEQADVVWGERINHKTHGSFKQFFGTLTKNATSWMGQLIFKSQIEDWFTGFFAVNRTAAKYISRFHLERYCEVQMLCIFLSGNLTVKTHRIQQLDRQFGKSRIGWLDGVFIFLRSTLMMILYALRMQPK
jgi:glycosyltransferase involved in cell wall biosynthesis